MKQYQQALADCNNAVALDPSLPFAYSIRGIVYYKLEQYRQALSDHNKVVELEGGKETAIDALAIAADKYALGDFHGAIEAAGRAVAMDPENAQAYDSRGIAYSEAKDYSHAMDDLNRALALSPERPETLCHRGVTELKLGKLDAAIADFSAAIDRKPNYPLAYYNRGIARMRNREYEASSADIQLAIQFDPRFALAREEFPQDKARGGHIRSLKNPDEHYYRACSRILTAKNYTAMTDLKYYLGKTRWKGQLAPSAVILLCLGSMVQHDPGSVKSMARSAEKRLDKNAWPYPVVRYLNKEISADDLIARANGVDQLTDAHAFIGVSQLLVGDAAYANPHLEWVRQNGNGALLSYDLAIREIEKSQLTRHRDTERT